MDEGERKAFERSGGEMFPAEGGGRIKLLSVCHRRQHEMRQITNSSSHGRSVQAHLTASLRTVGSKRRNNPCRAFPSIGVPKPPRRRHALIATPPPHSSFSFSSLHEEGLILADCGPLLRVAGILDAPNPSSSSRSCPDLLTLQISTDNSIPDPFLPTPLLSPVPYPYGQFASEHASRASSPETAPTPTTPTTAASSSSRHRGRSQKLSATGEKASRKARSVLGRVRALRHIAARKMAHSPIRINTDVHGTKRGLSHETNGGADYLTVPGHDHATDNPSVELPPFLNISRAEARKKLEDLEWLQRARIQEGHSSKDPTHRWALESNPEVQARTRYLGVQAWANSRIHLNVPEGRCDFINASPIVLEHSRTGERTRYIATQGPKEGFQQAHFWHMVFHESDEVAVIVMLTQATESGKEKCAQYFPLDQANPVMELSMDCSDSISSGEDSDEEDEAEEDQLDFHVSGSVTLLESHFDESCRSEIRKMQLQYGDESKIVWHFLFAGWADFSKPEGKDREALLRLFKETAAKSASPDNPRIVHCSAGVGRTGTFIALDHLMRELESGDLLSPDNFNKDPVFDIVNSLREQRMMMVYNDEQLHFIYEVLREQSILKLGGSIDDDLGPELRSPKVARLSGEDEQSDASKPEVETAATPLAESPVDSPVVSDDE